MVAYKSSGDPPYVTRKIYKHRGQGSELDHRHRRRDLLRVAVVYIRPSAGEHEMRRRAYRNKLRETLDNTQDDSLKKIHKGSRSNRPD